MMELMLLLLQQHLDETSGRFLFLEGEFFILQAPLGPGRPGFEPVPGLYMCARLVYGQRDLSVVALLFV